MHVLVGAEDAGEDERVAPGETCRQTDLLATLGCDWVISKKGTPLQAGARWVIERTNSWHNRGFRKLAICVAQKCAPA